MFSTFLYIRLKHIIIKSKVECYVSTKNIYRSWKTELPRDDQIPSDDQLSGWMLKLILGNRTYEATETLNIWRFYNGHLNPGYLNINIQMTKWIKNTHLHLNYWFLICHIFFWLSQRMLDYIWLVQICSHFSVIN